jgi:flagellar hook-associated protein 1 FlgK
MSLTQALNTSLSGLHATQAGLSLIASNVANAQTPGYVRKSLLLTTAGAGNTASFVQVAGVQRELDQYVQRQLRVETAGGGYADLRANFLQQLQQIYGQPGSESAFETVYSNFTSAVQSLETSPESPAARSLVLSSAQVLAQSLNNMTTNIQALRSDAESGLSDAVATANNAMQQIASLNIQLAALSTDSASSAALADQRDRYIDDLAQLMDIRVVDGGPNQVNVFTASGVQLVGSEAAQLSFNPQGTVSALTLWNADPAESSLGTLSLVSSTGGSIDLAADKMIRSGAIAGYLDMRDNVLVQAQNQLDSIAAAVAQALSSVNVDGTAVTSGAQSGFEVDLADLQSGNIVHLDYTDNLTGTQHRVSIIRVDDPSVLPLTDAATPDANDEVIGIDFSGGMASVVAQLNTAFGGSLDFSNTSGSILQVLDDGGPDQTDVDALSVTQTVTTLSSGVAALPFFTDGASAYTGAFTSLAPQLQGFAGRITVNPALLSDSSKLVLYDTNSAAGDPTRPDFIYQQLTSATFSFSSQSGIGIESSPYTGNIPGFLRQVLSAQGEASANATSLAQGQQVVVNALNQRKAETSGVNVDQEMANLIALQTAYAANARVMSTVKDMLDALLRL